MMSVATLERFPKTVSACHLEIIRLRTSLAASDDSGPALEEAKADARELRKELDLATADIDKLNEKIAGLSDEVAELENAAEDRKDPIDAINRFLDEVERPVGSYVFDVVHGPSTDRAILALFDAAERAP